MHTGDLGYFDEDALLFLIDRKKDMFKYCNHHVSPTELELMIEQNNDVQAVCVVGIPDDFAEHLPAAVIVRMPDSSITEDDIMDIIDSKIKMKLIFSFRLLIIKFCFFFSSKFQRWQKITRRCLFYKRISNDKKWQNQKKFSKRIGHYTI